ncbi:MAG: A/G-specific adenine glycosylase [Deltaproteobacteria bacterium]|nr:A/G-specific adenine glycosylase [Deltaproteobacteria bacterium]MBW1943022.1 A/G-specific adenine glycosylase [Deltaproteobacteria bacterium]MBW2208018.1 A/G-specific adenine glycosylase [Deltaproteobacteria bacterium]
MAKQGNIAKQVIGWYAKHQRPLPWRKTRDPYAIWISEVMLQQTQVETVVPYYRRFLSKFPDVGVLAKTRLQAVLKVWENLGYYSRARHIHEAAKEIMERHNGRIPDSMEELRRLPGIGPYIAAAILCFAFGRQVPTVEANVNRVLCRLFGIRTPLEHTRTRKRIYDVAVSLVPKKKASYFNQGLMDLGATICTPRKPACSQCPLVRHCQALKSGIQEELPLKRKKGPLPHKRMTAAIIMDRERRFLIVQRPPRGLLGGLWKFPGGECMAGESLEKALKRTVNEELGIRAYVKRPLASVKHAYTHFRTTLHGFHCRRVGEPENLDCYRWEWAAMPDLAGFPFSKVDRKIMEAMKAMS